MIALPQLPTTWNGNGDSFSGQDSRTERAFFSTYPYKVHSSGKLLKVFTTHLWGSLVKGRPWSRLLALVLNKAIIPAIAFPFGFNEKESFMLPNHFLGLVAVISIQWQENLTRIMKSCSNTCSFLCHTLCLDSELVGRGGCGREARHPCITKEALRLLT